MSDRLRRGRVAVGEVVEHDPIVGAGQQFADRGPAVAASPARFLGVVFQRLGQVVVIHPADVGLVDAHAKRDRGDDRVGAASHEGILCLVPLLVRQAGMVGERLKSTLSQVARHLFGGLLQCHIDDRGLPPLKQPARQHPKPIAGRAGGDPVAEIRPQERILHMVRRIDIKRPTDVGRDRRRRRRRQRQHGTDAELLCHMRQPQVFRAEVMPPLRNTVGLIHCHHRDPGPREPRDELLAQEPLGRNVEQLERAAPDAVIHARRLGGGERRVEPRRRNTP